MLKDHKTIFFTNIVPFMSDERIISYEDIMERVASYGSFALQKNSEFKQMFDYHLMKARQSGLLGLTIDKWLREGKPDPGSSVFNDEATPLGFDNLLFMVLVVSAGAGASVLVDLLEWTYRRTCGSMKMKEPENKAAFPYKKNHSLLF